MARRLTTDDEIDVFIGKIIDEAQHHASDVVGIIMPLSQVVRERLNLARDSIEVYERNGKLARTCWITLAGNRYVFSYHYAEKKIDLRERSLQGRSIYQFDNQTTVQEIAEIVATLAD